MRTFDYALFELFNDGHIGYEEALRNADSANELRLNIKLNGTRAASPSGPRTEITLNQPKDLEDTGATQARELSV